MATASWNDRVRSVVVGLEAEIPEAGVAIAALTELFWPESGEDIWESIKAQVSVLVDSKILAKELEERREELDGLREAMKDYAAARDHEKGAWMAAMLVQANIMYSKLTESANATSLIPLAVAAAHLHLTLFRERLNHGTKIYQEDNSSQWQKELSQKCDDYVKFFRTIYPRWKNWRDTTVEIDYKQGGVRDNLTGEQIVYNPGGDGPLWNLGPKTVYTSVCDATQERMRNAANAAMVEALDTTCLLHRYLPGHESDPPDVDPPLSTVWLGPYSVGTLGISAGSNNTIATVDPAGVITFIHVREWNSIDGLQFIYATHDGQFTGDPSGGADHRFDLKHGYDGVAPANQKVRDLKITSVAATFANGIIISIVFGFDDGTGWGPLGNRSGWGGTTGVASAGPNYVLISSQSGGGSGPSGTVGTGIIKFQFAHLELRKKLEEAALAALKPAPLKTGSYSGEVKNANGDSNSGTLTISKISSDTFAGSLELVGGFSGGGALLDTAYNADSGTISFKTSTSGAVLEWSGNVSASGISGSYSVSDGESGTFTLNTLKIVEPSQSEIDAMNAAGRVAKGMADGIKDAIGAIGNLFK